ncbi:MAG: hypothetical protein ABIT38_06800, partial [Gemmatimonadaceae bacterium]
VWVRLTLTAAIRRSAATRFDDRRVLALSTRPAEILLPGHNGRLQSAVPTVESREQMSLE